MIDLEASLLSADEVTAFPKLLEQQLAEFGGLPSKIIHPNSADIVGATGRSPLRLLATI